VIAGRHEVLVGRSWAAYAAIRLPYVAPGTTHEAVWVPQVRPVRIRGVRAAIEVGAPEIGYFARARRAGGSRRRGRLASQDWAAACLAVRRDPARHPARVDVAGMEIGAYSLLVTGDVSLAMLGGRGEDVVVSPVLCQPGEEIRIRVVNRDCRSMAIALELRCQEES